MPGCGSPLPLAEGLGERSYSTTDLVQAIAILFHLESSLAEVLGTGINNSQKWGISPESLTHRTISLFSETPF